MAPTVFYRVQHEGSRVQYSEEEGFTAMDIIQGDLGSMIGNLDDEIVEHFENHCNKIHVPTALISMCSSREGVLERAIWEEDNGRNDVRIYEIHPRAPAMLSNGMRMVYRDARRLARRIRDELEAPEDSDGNEEEVILNEYWRYLKDEWVVFNEIPPEAIVYDWTVEEFEDEMSE